MSVTQVRDNRLAIDGGTPVRPLDRTWPWWPRPAEGVAENLNSVLRSGRWAISSPLRSTELFERRFARQFADYVGARHCVPVDHGSSALVVALESLGLDFGDRVLVPALTWVASATAALRAGLVPVLVDVDPVFGCMAQENLDLDVNARALVVVHWSCAMADIPALASRASSRAMSIVEDCAQAHGAQWAGRCAGTLGDLGCFSMQNGKVLTAGEGGAVVTDSDERAVLLEELRADSRSYRRDVGRPGELEMAETASIMGSNFCLSEFNSAILCAQLDDLDRQHEMRNANHRLLVEMLADVDGVRVLQPHPQQTKMSIYELPLIFEHLPRGMTVERLGNALSAELGTSFYPTDAPLHLSPLLRPWNKGTLRPLTEEFMHLHEGRAFPNADFFGTHAVVTHHSTLLGDERDMSDIASAVVKVLDE